MHRTQIYFEEDTFEQMKKRTSKVGITVSEFIRTIVEKELQKNEKEDFISFLDNTKALDSFKNIDSSKYVVDIRSKSRILDADFDR